MSDHPQFNPYKPPEYLSGDSAAGKPGHQIEFEPLPWPQCRGTDIQPSPYSAWHGRRAAKAIQDVTCQGCGCNYNGETGVEYPPRKNPMIWFIIALILFMLYVVGYFGFIISASF